MKNRIREASKLKLNLFFFFLGSLSCLGFEPFNFFFLTIISYSLALIFLNKTKNLKAVFLLGVSFGLGHYLVGLYWIAVSFEIADAGGYFAGSIAIFLLCFFLSLFNGLSFYIIKKYCKNFFCSKSCVVIILTLTFFDWLKGNILWGFPWLPISAIWSFDKHTLYPFSILGVWGYSLLTFSMITGIIFFNKNIYKFIALIVPIPLIMLYPILSTSKKESYEEKITVKIVQPNIAQKEKWKKENLKKNLYEIINLSQLDTNKNVDLIIWPETAVFFNLEKENKYNKIFQNFISNLNYILLGAIRQEQVKSDIKIYNSAFLINKKKKEKSFHDKVKLVPFGEFVPLRKVLSFSKITQGNNDFSKGETAKVLTMDNVNILPLICYEVIFPDFSKNIKKKYNLIVNITNDAWYGNTSGPYQHFALAKIRAVQEGLTLIRVANNGISGIIRHDGVVTSKLELGVKGVIKKEISLYKSNTLYKAFGDKIFYGLFMVLLTSLIYFEVRLRGKNEF